MGGEYFSRQHPPGNPKMGMCMPHAVQMIGLAGVRLVQGDYIEHNANVHHNAWLYGFYTPCQLF